MYPLFFLGVVGILGYATYKFVMMKLDHLFGFIATTEIHDVWDD